MKFDKYQQEYINYPLSPEGNDVLLVKAVAGAGKTTSTIEKIKFLIVNNYIDSNRIVVVTFSNRMGSQIRRKLRKFDLSPMVGTIHSLIYSKLRETSSKISILTEWESIKIVRDFIAEAGVKYDTKKDGTALAKRFLEYLYFMRANCLEVTDNSLWQFFSDTAPFTNQNFYKIYSLYEDFKDKNNFWDFDDLISIDKLSKYPNLIDERVLYVFHDEAQDGSYANHKVLEYLFPKANFILIYDNLQKLYSFRYAYSEPMDNPEEYWKGRNIHNLVLPYNYRSDGNIIKISNVYRGLVDDLVAIPTKPEISGSVNILTVKVDTQVGKLIVNHIKELVGSGYSYKDITILVRKSSFIKTNLEPSFVKHNIPYKVKTPLYKKKFFEIPLNNFFLSAFQFKVTNNPMFIYEVSNLWIGIGESFKKRVTKYPNLKDPKIDVINKFINSIRHKKLDSVKDIINFNLFLASYAKENLKPTIFTDKQINITLKIFSNFIKQLMEEEITDLDEVLFHIVQRIQDYDDSQSDKIEITTVHQYKGLENKVIFVTDMNDFSFQIDDSTYPVYYTALTRAMEKLYIINYQYANTFKMGTISVKPYPKYDEFIKKLKELKENRE